MSADPAKCGDEEFSAALSALAAMARQRDATFLFLPDGGVTVAVDDEVHAGCFDDSELTPERFTEVVRDHIAPLVFPVAADMSDAGLFSESGPFGGLTETQQETIRRRRDEVGGALDADALRGALRAKSRVLGLALADLDWDVFRWAGGERGASTDAMAVLSLRAEPPARGTSSLREYLRKEAAELTLTLTLADVHYVMQQLRDLEKRLSSAQQEVDDDPPG